MSSSDSTRKTLEGATDEYTYERTPDEPPSQAVVSAVAEATGRPVLPNAHATDDGADALPPLFETVDPDALDTLVTTKNTDGDIALVTFTYGDYTVTVDKQRVTVIPSI